jgi:hypothetical protein
VGAIDRRGCPGNRQAVARALCQRNGAWRVRYLCGRRHLRRCRHRFLGPKGVHRSRGSVCGWRGTIYRHLLLQVLLVPRVCGDPFAVIQMLMKITLTEPDSPCQIDITGISSRKKTVPMKTIHSPGLYLLVSLSKLEFGRKPPPSAKPESWPLPRNIGTPPPTGALEASANIAPGRLDMTPAARPCYRPQRGVLRPGRHQC